MAVTGLEKLLRSLQNCTFPPIDLARLNFMKVRNSFKFIDHNATLNVKFSHKAESFQLAPQIQALEICRGRSSLQTVGGVK